MDFTPLSLNKYLSVDTVILSIDDELLELTLPPGWNKFVCEITKAAIILHISSLGVKIVDGVLYISPVKIIGDDYITTNMFNRIVRTFSQDTSKTCMVCGNFGIRRKEQPHKPVLCSNHYLQYINTQDQ